MTDFEVWSVHIKVPKCWEFLISHQMNMKIIIANTIYLNLYLLSFAFVVFNRIKLLVSS